MKISIYNQEYKKLEDNLLLDKFVWAIEPNKPVVHKVIVAYNASLRQGSAKVKDRSEVRGGGKKPWAQKGTGNARHGSNRSPIWRGGGITFGPNNNVNYRKKVNKKINKLAFRSVLSDKLKHKAVLVVDSLTFDSPKTKNTLNLLKDFKQENKKVLFITNKWNENLYKSSKNLKKVFYNVVGKTSLYQLLNANFLILDKDSVEYYNKVLKKA